MIKIIAGKHKNKSIRTPKNNNTRPTSIRLRETIFNILLHSNNINIKICNTNVLDLFAGSGSFGFECLSRGFKSCVFVENNIESLKVINENVRILNEEKNSKVIKHDATKPLKKNLDINLCFLDPPYKINKISDILINWASADCISKDAIYILEKKNDKNYRIPKNFELIDSRKQGLSEVIFFKILSSTK